jgi:serine/threonine protein kinase/HPt (histidine-containing phosphotransfer) domain-containing protein
LKDGTIEIINQVGAGGIGEVYRASMIRDGVCQQVAIKCFNPKTLLPTAIEAIEMVHRESLSVCRIHHPNIVRVFEVNTEGNFPFIVEEFLEGGDLAQLIDQRRRNQKARKSILSPQEIASLGHQICAGLMKLHELNQFHGDLKPRNICFRDARHSETVIVDFGHAGFVEDSLMERNELSATLGYIPPERTGSVKTASNSNSDLYSLGVTLYEAALGRPPFAGKDSRDIVNRLLYEVPKPLCEIFPGFPLALSDIISKLLRKNHQDRYHSAFGLSTDFERCLNALKEGRHLEGFALGTKDKLRELNYRIPMVGRSREISKLLSTFDDTRNHGAEVIFIGAPSGTGKSRLAFEVLRRARATASIISHAKFSEFELNLPLSAISLLLLDHALYLRTRPPEDLQQWQRKILDRLGARGHRIAERFPYYEGLLPDFPTPPKNEQDSSLESFNQCLGEFMTLLAASGETQLIFLDDLQWADWQSIQVLKVLADKIGSKEARSIMLMGTYRSNEVNGDHPLSRVILQQCPEKNLIELGPLSRADSDLLVEVLLEEQGTEINKLQDVTYRFTEGNPFYIYEYLKSALHTGIYAFDEVSKSWYFEEARIHQASFSAGVAALVGDRIRLLKPIDLALIGIASIAGQAMNRRALAQILPLLLDARGQTEAFSKLQDRDLYIELAYQELLQKNLLVPDTMHFRLFHDKVQEASYSTLSEEEKAILHPAYGHWCAKELESNGEKGNDALVFEAAYHLIQGDRSRLDLFACRFLVKAAKISQNVFAYDKAKDYLTAVIMAHDAQAVFSNEEKFEALELLANTLTISDQVREALVLYDRLLEFDCTPLKRASILCKKSEFGLSIFEYQVARDASIAGLKSLGARYLTSELASYLYILFFLPALVVYALYFSVFGRQTREITDEETELRFQLQLKNQMSQYFILPVVAIANLVMVTFKLLSYKECYARTTVFCNWGISLCPFGMEKLGSKFLARAYDYFDRMADPVNKAYVLFIWGNCCDMAGGRVQEAQKKLEEAVRILEPIGESFWRSCSINALLVLDYYGSESGQAGRRAHELIDQWKKLRFEPTGLAAALRVFLEQEREEQLAYTLNLCHQSADKLHESGFDSIDSVMAWLSIGEYYESKGDLQKATELLRRATWLATVRLHRASHVTFAPIALARTLIHQKRQLEAFLCLCICWFNQLLNVRLFLPQTLFMTGYWLDSVGLKNSGQRMIESGIERANRQGWATVVAEGRLLLGRLMLRKRPEMSLVLTQLAKEYFQQRNWMFQSQICDRQIVLQKLAHRNRRPVVADTPSHSALSARRGGGIREKIEMKSLFEILLKLSAISQKDTLFQVMMETLCHATGSELALLVLKENDRWAPVTGFNIEIQSGDRFKSRVDVQFMERCAKAEIRQPLVRSSNQDTDFKPFTDGSAMMVPLIYESRIHGYCYLANTQIYEIYDAQSIEIAVPIAIQATIAMQNIALNNELAIERDQLAELHRTLEQRVLEQTRDVKSIMQNINTGICTVSSTDILIDKDYSLFLEKLLHESALFNKEFLPLLLSHSQLGEDEKDQLKNMLRASMNELEMAFRVNDHILPRTLHGTYEGSPFVLELEWIPILSENHMVEKVLVTISDVTELRALEAQAHQKDREMKVAIEILGCSHREWALFISNCQKLLEQNTAHADNLFSGVQKDSQLRKIFVNLHTIKGNARALGFKLMNETTHEIEQYFSNALRQQSEPLAFATIQEKLAEMASIVATYREIAEQRLGRTSQSSQMIALNRDRLLEVYTMIQAAEAQGLVSAANTRLSLDEIRETLFLSVEAIFQHLLAGIETLAIDLGKAKPKLEIHSPRIWATDQAQEILRNSFLHLIRNSLDHGIETPDERADKGKNPEGTITIVAEVHGLWVDFRLTDDGRGLNLKKIAAIGSERGLIQSDQLHHDQAVANLVFMVDVSTAESVTDISGRGVGMTAVAQYVQEAGGSIHIELLNQPMDGSSYRPCAFIVSLPRTLFQTECPLILKEAS